MASQSAPSGQSALQRHLSDFLSGIRHWAEKERARRAALAEIQALDDAGMLQESLHEFGMNRDDVDMLVNADPDALRRMETALRQFGVAERVEHVGGALARDIQTTCLRCDHGQECDAWLASERRNEVAPFCMNGETFAALQAAASVHQAAPANAAR